MKIDNQYKRHVLYFMYLSGESARNAANKLNNVHEETLISARTAQKWYQRFKAGQSDVEDQHRSGRPVDFDIDALVKLVDSEPELTVDEFAKRLGSSHGTVYRHLQEIGKVSKLKKDTLKELKKHKLKKHKAKNSDAA